MSKAHKKTSHFNTNVINIIIHRLVPNVILKFAYEGASCGLQEFLKEDLLMLVQQI